MLETSGTTHSPETLEHVAKSASPDAIADETQALLDEIQNAVNQYTGSLNSLSHKSGVDPKTIRKIKNGEYKRAPNAETIQRLLSVVSKQRTLRDIANFYGGHIEAFLQRAFPQFFLEDAQLKSKAELMEELEEKITDVYTYQMVKVVKGKGGVPKHQFLNTLCKFIIKMESRIFEDLISEEEVSNFMPLASLKLSQMIKSGLLKENRETGHIVLFDESIVWKMPFEICRKYEGSSMNFFQMEHADKLDYFWRTHFGNVSYKELNQISHIMWDAFNKAAKIINSSTSKDIKINLTSVLNSLQYHTPGEAREEQIGRRRQLDQI